MPKFNGLVEETESAKKGDGKRRDGEGEKRTRREWSYRSKSMQEVQSISKGDQQC